MPKLTSVKLLIIALVIANTACSQLKIQQYGAAWRLFEVDAVGNNPTTIASLLKDPSAYRNFIDTISYNELWGNPGVQPLHTFYLTLEWKRDSAQSQFWRHYTVEASLLLTNKLSEPAGAIGTKSYSFSPDTVIYEDVYSLQKTQQFAGVGLGLNRRLRISNRLQFFSGLHLQGSVAIVNHFHQQWDSTRFSKGVWTGKTTTLPTLKGKNFFQWQAMLPLALECNVYKNLVFARLEFLIGLVGSPYRPATSSAREAHGGGLSVMYRPCHRN